MSLLSSLPKSGQRFKDGRPWGERLQAGFYHVRGLAENVLVVLIMEVIDVLPVLGAGFLDV